MSVFPALKPGDPDVLLIPRPSGDGSTYEHQLGPDGDSWCLGCEAFDFKPWRFTEEMAARMEWVLCADHTDLLRVILVRQDDE